MREYKQQLIKKQAMQGRDIWGIKIRGYKPLSMENKHCVGVNHGPWKTSMGEEAWTYGSRGSLKTYKTV